MKLMIDIGNSCFKWAFCQQDTLMPQQRFSYHHRNLDDLLTQLWATLTPPESIWVANVAGVAIAKQLTQWVNQHWQLTPVFVQTTFQSQGVTNGYHQADQLGVDRWLALLAAYHIEKQRLCVVDCGTAVTLDVVSATGQHQGGLIMPGVALMRHALCQHTQALSSTIEETVSAYQQILAQDTQTGIVLGTLNAVIGLMEQVLETFVAEPNSLVLTGGSAPGLLPLLNRPYQHIPDLVLRGLMLTAHQNS
ncbi:MAG: type III pantothenate kinase [Pseudomonadota bacterium]|nr:type III pantothenate kinase [Pseudomonadota bacterium]